MKFIKSMLLMFSIFGVLFITSCNDDTNTPKEDNETENSTNDNSIGDNDSSGDESNPDDGIDWPSEIVWP